mgnify:CR=1 FL=1
MHQEYNDLHYSDGSEELSVLQSSGHTFPQFREHTLTHALLSHGEKRLLQKQ